VLLEYEQAIEYHELKTKTVLPIFVGYYVKENGTEKYCKFKSFGVELYPEQSHILSSIPVRKTMERLFKIQGIDFNPRDSVENLVDEIMKYINT